MNSIPDQPQNAIFSFFADPGGTTPLSPEPTVVIFTLTVVGSSNDAAHPPTFHTVGTDPNASRIGAAQYKLAFTPPDYGTWRVDCDGFDVSGDSVGAQYATVQIDPRPAAIPVG